MAKPTGFTLFKSGVFVILGLIAIGFFWQAPKLRHDERAQTQVHSPAAKASSEKAADASGPGAAVQNAVMPAAPPAPQENRWLDGETVWSSVVEKNAVGGLHRVRLVQSPLHDQLLRVEEEVTAGEKGKELQITRQKTMVATQLMIKAAPGVSQERLAAAVRPLGGAIMRQIPGSEVFLISIPAPDGNALPAALQAINNLPGVVAYAEPDFIVHATTTPNDTRFAEQWSLNNTGQTSGTADADIDAPEAWALTTGSNSVIVAVLDSGVDYTHPDLSANIWTNPGEIAGNGIDDDGNGYIDDTRGWNFLSGNNNPADTQNHGTHVAGIIGAAGNNNAGISGVAWQVKLMPVKFLSSSGFGTTSDAIAGINYARVKGAHIINHSWGGTTFSQLLKDAIDAAGTSGILNVCAANNGNGTNEDVTPNYPSGFASASIIAVASTTETDALSNFSDYGPSTVHLGAPGSNILSTLPNSAYGLNSGTSMATPHVSGIAALVKAYKPSATGADLKAILQSSVDVIPALSGRTTSGGRANAVKALQISSDISVVPSSSADFLGNHGGPFLPATKTYTLKNHGAASASWSASLSTAYYASVSPASGTLAPGASTTVTVTLNTTLANAAAPGLYDGKLTFTNTTSGKTLVWPVRMDVRVPYIYSYDLSTDPGWPREEAWQFGTPQGRGGGSNGNADPTSGHSGSNVFGVNLNGDIPSIVNGPHYLVAGPFDLRGYTQTTLDYWRWLNTLSYNMLNSIEVRNESSQSWTTLWSNTNYVSDNAWTEQVLPLGADGDGHSAVYIRWKYEVTSTASPLTTGWNLDDIKITGIPGRRVFLDGVSSQTENTGSASLLLHVEPASPTDLTISLASSDTSAATLPLTVLVPANTSSVSVTATLIDDALVDGTQTAVLTASTSGYTSIPWNLAVTDNETAVLSLNVAANGTEGGAAIQGTVSMNKTAGQNVVVALASSQPGAAAVPASVTIRAGQTSATFAIMLPQNGMLEGAKTANITATVANWTGASANITVADDEAQPPTLTFPFAAGDYNLAEGVDTSSYTATVSLSGPALVDTLITLTMNDTSEMTLPASVTIPAGKVSATISPITVIDDALNDGVQTVTVTAAAAGLSNGTANVTVADNEVVSFVFDYISSPQTGGGSEYHNVWALDVQGALAAGYNGTATLSGLDHGAVDPAYNGSSSITFYRGGASFSIGYPPVSSSYSIRAVAGAATGTSNSFTVEGPAFNSASVSANEIAYDPVTNRVYASTNNGTVVPINPDTGATEAPITVGTGAVGQIEIPTTGGILYALINNRTQLVKVDLVAKTAGTPFGLGSYISSPLTVRDFAVLPNDSNTVGVVLYPQGTSDHVAIYTNGVKRTTVITYDSFSSNNPVIATQITAGGTANRFYASNGSAYVNSNRTLYLLDVGAGGVTLNRSYSEPGTLTNLTASGGLVADDTGRVYDGESGNSLGRIGDGSQAAVLLDSITGRACRIMHTTPYYYDPYALSVFELNGYSETGRAVTNTTVPATDGDSLPTRIVKAGTRTVAYRAASSVMLVKSFLLPDPATAAPDLAVQQMTAPYTIESGKPMSFNMLVRNTGSATAANVTLTSDWTPGAAYLGASTTQGTLVRNGSHLTVNIGSLAVGKAVTVCLQLSGGSNDNRAVVTTSDTEPFTLNNVHAVSTYPAPNSAPFNYLPILGRDIVSSKDLQRVYAPNGFGGRYFAGTVAVMDLSAPAVRAFVPIGSAPGCLALSEDGATLFVGLDGTGQVVPVDVATLTPGAAFTLGSAADGRSLFANDMAVLPGSGGNMVIARQDSMGAQAGVALFSNGAAVGTATPTTEFTRWVTAGENGGVCYGYGPDPTDFSGTSGKLYRMDVNSGGVSISTSRSGVTPGRRVGFASGKVLAANGKMFDATTLADAGALVDSSVYPYQLPLLTSLDTARERIYALSTAGNTPLLAFNSLTFAKTAQSSSNSYSGSGERLVRWGNSGLAFCAVSSSSNTNAGVYWRDSANLVPDPPLHVNLPAAVAENAGVVSAAGTVQLTVAPSANLTVNLTSSNPALLQVPASVTVPAGQTSATFNLTVTNDGLLNGARSVTVTPSGPSGYVLIAGSAEVSDDETGILALSVPSSATEGAGIVSGQATVSLANGPAGADVTVRLSSNRTDKLNVPASVIIPAGQSTASFDLTLLNDSKIDGTQVVGITAAVTGWTSANASINVLDNEATTFTSSLGTEVSEGRGSYSITFYLTGTAQQDIVVSLTSSNPSKFSVPASVTIKAGTTGISFYGDVPNNTLQDGRQTVTITATAAGLTTLTQNIIVIDNDIAVLQWGNIPNITAGDFVTVSVTGTTIDGDPAAFQYYPTLTPAATRNGNSVGGVSGTLSLGGSFNVFTGNVRVTESGGNTILTVSQDGITASSNAFTVAPGPMSSFAWDAIPVNLPQPATPLSTTVYATDGYGNRLTGYSGTASLSAVSAAGTAAVNTSGTSSIPTGIETSKDQSRMTLLVFPNQVNRSGRLRSLSLEVQTPPGRPFAGFLIRAKQTSTGGVSTYWDNSGYTVLRQGPLDLTQSKGWVEIPFTTPLDYNGTSNLQFDISFTTTGTAAGGAYFGYSNSNYAVGNSANSSQGYGSPENWSTNNPFPGSMGFPNLKLSFGTAVAVTPTVTGNFTNGVWTGSVTFSQAASNVVLIASNDISTGTSNVFEVGAVPPAAPVISSTLPAYSAATSTTITWGAVATATEYYAEAATSNTFTTPVANSGWITGTTYTFTNLTNDTHYYYRVKARKVSLEGAWSNVVDSTQDSAGPKIYLSNVDDAAITTFTTTRSPVLIQGHITDTSGIASFSIISGGNTYPWTVNADGTWSVNLSTPSTGTFGLSFYGVDKASAPANTTLRNISITRTADTDNNGLPDDWQAAYGLPLNGAKSTQTADFDNDGRKNLLEYAFNTPPNSSAGNTLPSVANEIKSADGKTYLVYRYDRRRGALDLTYSLEFSTDLGTWSGTSQQTELTGTPTLNPDGITERVTTRILPDISQFAGQKVFVRLKVTNSTP